MRIVFAGTPEFSVPCLEACRASGAQVVAVYTQPDRPAGRGRKLAPSPVKQAALAAGLAVEQPDSLKSPEAQATLAAFAPDLMVVVAYGLILPPPMLDAPRRGCLNIHASLLPRWRGAAPIQAAILAGDPESGVTIMRMDSGLDTGPTLLREAVPIDDATTAATLHDALAALGARLILRALDEDPAPVAQPDAGATYAPKLTREDGRIDWTLDAPQLLRRIRALNPWPGTYASLGGEPLKLLAAGPAEGAGAPGTVLDGRMTIACGVGAIRVLRMQRPGRAAIEAGDFLRGHPVPAGTVLG